jgi:RHS repeat-associated protein
MLFIWCLAGAGHALASIPSPRAPEALASFACCEEPRLASLGLRETVAPSRYSVPGLRLSGLYDGWQIIEERDGNNDLENRYVYGTGINEVVKYIKADGFHRFFTYDGLGSMTEVTGGDGNLHESYTYEVYGTVTMRNAGGNIITATGNKNRLHFTGYELDPDTGLYLARNRWYHPRLGRFMQPDPIGLAGGDLNLYRYCGNNPVNGTDPLGLWTFQLTAGYGYAVKLSVGYNSGRMSVGAGFGYGLGLKVDVDPFSRKPGFAETATAGKAGVIAEVGGKYGLGGGIDAGFGVNGQFDCNNNALVKTDLTLQANLAPIEADWTQFGGTLELGIKANGQTGKYAPHFNASPSLGWGIGGAVYGGVYFEGSWRK